MRTGAKINWAESASTITPQIRADGVHVWPFDAALPVAVTFQVFGERQPVRMNRHDYFEIVYVIDGEITCQIANHIFRCKKGELIVIGSSLYHCMWRHTRAHPKIATLFFMPEAICEAAGNEEHAEFLMPFYLQEVNFPFIVGASTGIPAEVFGLIRRTYETLPAHSSLARLSVCTYLKMALILLVNHYSPYIESQHLNNPEQVALRRIVPLFEFLETHYNQAINVEDGAALLGLSKPHFMRLFKQVTGQSFLYHLNHFRIAKAQALLTSTDMPLAELSQEVGFCDQSYFGSVFRKIVHMTPMAYRRRFGKSTVDTHIHLEVGSLQLPRWSDGGQTRPGRIEHHPQATSIPPSTL